MDISDIWWIQGRASGGREMVELGHPPGNETARSIPGKLAGNLNFQDWTIKWEGNLISSSIRRHVRLFIWIFFHFWFIKHKPWLLLSVKHKIWSRGSIQNTPGGFTDFAGKIWDVYLVETISRPRLDLGLPKLDQICFHMRRSILALDLWSNCELSLTKNRAWKQVV